MDNDCDCEARGTIPITITTMHEKLKNIALLAMKVDTAHEWETALSIRTAESNLDAAIRNLLVEVYGEDEVDAMEAKEDEAYVYSVLDKFGAGERVDSIAAQLLHWKRG